MIITAMAYIFGVISGIITAAIILTDWRSIGRPVDFGDMDQATPSWTEGGIDPEPEDID